MSTEDRVEWIKAVRQKLVASRRRNTTTGQLDCQARAASHPSCGNRWLSFCVATRTRVLHLLPSSQRMDSSSFLAIRSVCSATMGQPLPRILPTAITSLSNFRTCTEDEVREVIMCSPSKSCSLNPIPTTILKECIDDLLPILTAMCNASLLEGHLPACRQHVEKLAESLYHAIDQEITSSRCDGHEELQASLKSVSYLQENDLMPVEQSAYRKNHSTETALLRVITDLLNSIVHNNNNNNESY